MSTTTLETGKQLGQPSKPLRKFLLLRGVHVQNLGLKIDPATGKPWKDPETGKAVHLGEKHYKAGDTIETDIDLAAQQNRPGGEHYHKFREIHDRPGEVTFNQTELDQYKERLKAQLREELLAELTGRPAPGPSMSGVASIPSGVPTAKGVEDLQSHKQVVGGVTEVAGHPYVREASEQQPDPSPTPATQASGPANGGNGGRRKH